MSELNVSEKQDLRRHQKWDFLLAFFLIALALETLPLRSSLWLDETLTHWISSGTVEDVWRRTISFQGQSPLYYMVAWSVLKIFPGSDLAPHDLALRDLELRLLSVLCASGGVLLLYRYISLSVTLPFLLSYLVSIAFLSDVFQVLFLSARPYALAFMFAMASIVTLGIWTKEKKHTFLVLYLLTTLLTFYAHYLFSLVVLLHLGIVGTTKVFRSYLMVLPLLVIGAIPGFFHLLSLQQRAQVLSFAQKPTVMSFLQSFFPPALLIVFTVAVVLSIIWGGKVCKETLDKRLFYTALLWIFLPVFTFAGISVIGSTSLFTARYWSWQIGGIALLFSMIISAVTPVRAQRIAVMLLIIGMLFRLSVQTWRVEGWREAANTVLQENTLPVVLYSGLIEAEDPTFSLRNEGEAYLSAPLKRYGVTNLINSIGLRSIEDRERVFPSEEFFLVSILGRRGSRVAPESFIQLLKDDKRDVTLVSQSGTVSVYRVARNSGA
jgi:hypothetical protein